MHLLILGGTLFLGRHIVDDALERGHEVTLFNRGRTNPGLFPEVERILGGRRDSVAGLKGRTFDAAIDTSGYIRREVALTTEALSDAVDRYCFISSISVYADFSVIGLNEDAPVSSIADPDSEDVINDYPGLKALCETLVRDSFQDRSLVIRPGLIVGPHDPTNRFTYWVRRALTGGEMLVPGPPAREVQVIDARDLAAWTLDLIERDVGGTFNATSPGFPASGIIDACLQASRSVAEPVWVDPTWLLDKGVQPWTEMPVWAPEKEMKGLLQVDVSRAVAEGSGFAR